MKKMDYVTAMKYVYEGKKVTRPFVDKRDYIEKTFDPEADGTYQLHEWYDGSTWSYPQDTPSEEFMEDIMSNDWYIVDDGV